MEIKVKKQIENFFGKFQENKYKKGEIIMEAGKKSAGVLWIKKGLVRLYMVTESGKESTLPLFNDIFFMSLSTALNRGENNFYAEALSDCEVKIAPIAEVKDWLEKENCVEIMRATLKRLTELAETTSRLTAGNAYAKVASLIVNFADDFGEKVENGVKVKHRIPHRLIASITGLTRETVTLQMLKMEKEGLIRSAGRQIVVRELDKLRKISNT